MGDKKEENQEEKKEEIECQCGTYYIITKSLWLVDRKDRMKSLKTKCKDCQEKEALAKQKKNKQKHS